MRKPIWIATAKKREILPYFTKSDSRIACDCQHESNHPGWNRAVTATQTRAFLLILGCTLLLSTVVSLYFDFRTPGVQVASAAVRGKLAAQLWQMVTLRGSLLVLGLALIVVVGGKLIRGIASLQESMLRIKRLEGLLPICSQCKRVRLAGAERTRQDSWIAIETFIQDRTDAQFTHGLCPQCAHELYPGLFDVKAADCGRKSARI